VTDDTPFDELRQIVERQRAYAPIREGGTKPQKELGVLQDLLESMRDAGVERYSHPAIAPEDPPDCFGRTAAGQLAAFEVSELVSQEAIELNERTRRELGRRPEITEMVVRQWAGPDFLACLGAILANKDSRTFRGGPYAEIAVVIHTDEPLLVREQCEQWLANHRFGPFRKLTHAYLLYPYQPLVGYPYRSLFGAA